FSARFCFLERGSVMRLLTAFVVLAGCSGPAAAQVLYGSWVGSVRDPSGAAVPGAAVTIENTGTGFTRSGTTDTAGAWQFENVQSGTYEVRVSAPGFRSYQRTGVVLPVNAVVRVDAALEVG